MTRIDRLLIGALVLGVWALVAVQFFDGVTVEAAAAQFGGQSTTLDVRILNSPLDVKCK